MKSLKLFKNSPDVVNEINNFIYEKSKAGSVDRIISVEGVEVITERKLFGSKTCFVVLHYESDRNN